MNHKILLIGSSPGIGLTFHFTRLAIALKRMGNEVIVLSDRKEQYAKLPHELVRFGIMHYVSDSIDKSGMIGVTRGTKEIRRLLKTERGFDVIHAGGVKHSAKVFFATTRLNKKPKTFATIGSLPESKIGMSVAKLSYSLFYDKCIALCERSVETLTKWGVNPDKICVVPLFAPDLEWFDKARDVKIDSKNYSLQNVTKPVIFYAGGHLYHKGFAYYLMAASKILKKFDATFVVGGSGPLTSSLQNLAEKLGVSKHLVFTGWISNYHMPYVLSNIADICVSTSLVEQLPSYIMECMAAGRPVVASSVGGVPEVIVNEENGYLVPPCDYEETARRITDLISDPEKAKKMGLVGRKIIEDQLNMKSSVVKLMEVYEESVRSWIDHCYQKGDLMT